MGINPNLWQSYHQLAVVWAQKNDWAGAEQMLLKAISVNNSSELWRVLGVVYEKRGKKDKAKEAYGEALRLDAVR